MRIISYFILLVVLQSNIVAQNWIKYYGQGQNAVCRSIANDYDKGMVIGGMINNYTFSWIIKTDINGNTLWDKRFGSGEYSCGLENVEKTSDGGYIICGTWQKEDPEFDVFILKLNTCGEIEWCKTLYTPGHYELCGKVKTTPEGDYILTANYFETTPFSRTSLFKFNSSGDLLWQQFFPLEYTYYNDDVYDLLVDNDGYVVLTTRYYPDPGTTMPAIERHHLFKTDTAGNLKWDLVYGADNYYYGGPWSLAKSKTGAYYEAGRHLQQSMTESSPAFIKVSAAGNPLYDADIVGNVYWGGLGSVDILQDSLLVMVGGYSPDPNTSFDAFFKSDTLGNLRESKILLPKISLGYGYTCKTFDDKFVAVGIDAPNSNLNIVAVKVNSDLEYDSIYTQPFTYDSLCPYPIVSDTIDPDCENVYVGVDEPFKKPETTQLKVYPNPTDNTITIELPKYLVVTDNSGHVPATTIYHQWLSATLQAVDLQGKIVLQQEVSNTGVPLQVDVSHLPASMYLFRLVYKGQLAGSSKVVVR
jgi:hypothetical protein